MHHKLRDAFLSGTAEKPPARTVRWLWMAVAYAIYIASAPFALILIKSSSPPDGSALRVAARCARFCLQRAFNCAARSRGLPPFKTQFLIRDMLG